MKTANQRKALLVVLTALIVAQSTAVLAAEKSAPTDTILIKQERVANRSAVDPFQVGPGIAVTDTKAGKVQGFVHKGIYTYLGIPYAQAERFEAPHKVTPWKNIRMAVTYGDIAPQDVSKEADIFPPHWYYPHWEARNTAQGEDCQNLNIWTPGISDGKKRPVMVWFHGGGWQMGSASVEDVYNGENLARKGDVVVVSVNHRLNSLGFLDLSAYGDQYKDSANAGVLDLVASLQWVHDNITSFGGDPGNVTIFGQSGGGAKVLTMTSLQRAKGLFQKGIVESGATRMSGMSFPDQKATRRVAELTLKNLGLTPANVGQLRTMPYAQLSKAANAAMKQASNELGRDTISYWSPVRDGRIITQNPVVDGFSKNAENIPLLIGSVLNEWTTMDQMRHMDTAQRDNHNTWDEATVKEKMQQKYGDKADAVEKAFQEAYPDKKPADALYPDAWLRKGAIETANMKARQAAPVYTYVFTWETPVMGGLGMAYHCSEIPFVFNNIALSEPATGGGKAAYALADKMSQAWINFARTGDPNQPKSSGLPHWPAYTKENGAAMILDNHSEVRYHHDAALMELLGGKSEL